MKIAVAISGGVDSAFALKWAVEHFENITAVHLDFFNDNKKIKKVKSISERLKIPLKIFHLKDEFKEKVINYFISEYLSGNTPNPCVKCNLFFKFRFILERFDKVITGHYARIEKEKDRFFIFKGKDLKKDQAYFLARIPAESLERIIFPLGDFNKSEINIEKKKESQDICFIPDNDYKNFILKNAKIKNCKGFIKDKQGKILGEHNGFFNFTIGQRKGLNIAMGKPFYVTKIDAHTNTIYAGPDEDTICNKFSFSNPLWYDNPDKYENISVKVRYRSKEKACEIKGNIVNILEIERAVTPGQLAVFYNENKIIGSGWIENVG